MSHILIAHSPKQEKFMIYLILNKVSAFLASKSEGARNRDEMLEDDLIHSTATLEGAIVHAAREAAVIPARIKPHDPGPAFPIVLDQSVAAKFVDDGYDGDPTCKDKA